MSRCKRQLVNIESVLHHLRKFSSVLKMSVMALRTKLDPIYRQCRYGVGGTSVHEIAFQHKIENTTRSNLKVPIVEEFSLHKPLIQRSIDLCSLALFYNNSDEIGTRFTTLNIPKLPVRENDSGFETDSQPCLTSGIC